MTCAVRIDRIPAKATRKQHNRKSCQSGKANTGGAQVSKRRPNFTGAEVEVLLQNVDVSTMAISTRLSLVLIYLFTAICSVRIVILFMLGHHDASVSES